MEGTPIRILVIEDDDELRRVLVTLLEAEGYLVTAAEGGSQAVQAAHRSGFDLVVADIRMKGMDGLEALEAIQTEQPDVRSLVVTGYSTEADSIRAIRLGVSDYLTKPFRLDSFLDAINAIVAKRRRELEKRAERDRLRTTLLWATRLVASYADKQTSATRRPLLETAGRAAQVARHLGLSDIAREQVQLATFLAGLGVGLGPVREVPGQPTPSIPPAIMRILGSLEERWDGQGGPEGLSGEDIPLESRLIAAVLATRDLTGGEPAGSLESRDPGRFDLRILELLEVPEPAAKAENELDSGQRRGLLSLARAMEEIGNSAAANDAYRSVAGGRGAGREQVEALVALYRLEKEIEYAEKALQLGGQVGPWTRAWASLELGLLAAESHPEYAAGWVRAAGRLYTQMEDSNGQARATLALAAVNPDLPQESLNRAAETLLRAENRSHLAQIGGQVLPYLLSQETLSDNLHRLAKRALREVPGAMKSLLSKGRLSAGARLKAVELLQGMAGDAPQDILQILSRDLDDEVQAAVNSHLSTASGASSPPLLRLFSMGPFEVFLGDERVPEGEWKTQKIKALMAWLGQLNGQPLPQDRILEALWPGDPEKGAQSLYWSTSVLRKLLAPLHEDSKQTVMRRRKALYVNPELPQWHDLDELRRGAGQARERLKSGVREWAVFRRLLELYRGPYLEEFDFDWLMEVRHQVSREVGTVLLSVSQLALRSDQVETALEFACRLSELEPLNAEAVLVTMKAQTELGRHPQAVRQFEELQRRLESQGIEAPIPLVEAYERAKLSI